ncbi:hypothetical protein L0F63_004707 [Massospora cicadina]|nr:hypothetical protein L0F63_004707 [Massospora cicadina]
MLMGGVLLKPAIPAGYRFPLRGRVIAPPLNGWFKFRWSHSLPYDCKAIRSSSTAGQLSASARLDGLGIKLRKLTRRSLNWSAFANGQDSNPPRSDRELDEILRATTSVDFEGQTGTNQPTEPNREPDREPVGEADGVDLGEVFHANFLKDAGVESEGGRNLPKTLAEAISRGELKAAVLQWKAMHQAGEAVDADGQLSLIRALVASSSPSCRAAVKEIAPGIVENLDRAGWDPDSLNQLLLALGTTSVPGLSEKLFQLLTRPASKLRLEKVTAERLIDMGCVEGDAPTLMKVFKSATDAGYFFNPESYIKLLNFFGARNHMVMVDAIVTRVFNVAELMNLGVYGAAMAAYKWRGNVEAVMQLFASLKARGLAPDLAIFSTVIRALGKAGRIDEMLQHFDSLAEYHLQPNAIFITSLMYAQPSKQASALKRLAQLIAGASTGTAVLHNRRIFACLIMQHLLRGDLDAAKAVKVQMVASGVTPTWSIFVLFLSYHAKALDLPQALQVFEEMKAAGMEVNTLLLTLVVKVSLDCNHPETAYQLISAHPHVPLDIVTYTVLMRYYAKAKYPERVFQCYRAIKRLKIPMTAVAYDVVLHTMARYQREALLPTFHEMVNEYGIQPDPTIFNTMMRGLAVGAPARRTAPPTITTYNMLLSAYLRMNWRGTAFRLLEHLIFLGQHGSPELLPNPHTWCQVLWSHAKARDIKALEADFRRFSDPPSAFARPPRDLTKAKRIFQFASKRKDLTSPKLVSLYLSILGAEGSLTALQREWRALPTNFGGEVVENYLVHNAYHQALVRCGGYQEAVDAFASHVHPGGGRFYVDRKVVTILAKALHARRRSLELAALRSHVLANFPHLVGAIPEPSSNAQDGSNWNPHVTASGEIGVGALGYEIWDEGLA